MNRLAHSSLPLFSFVYLLLSAVSPAQGQSPDVSAHPMIGEPAPPIELLSTDGERLGLEFWKGNFVVLHFGASW